MTDQNPTHMMPSPKAVPWTAPAPAPAPAPTPMPVRAALAQQPQPSAQPTPQPQAHPQMMAPAGQQAWAPQSPAPQQAYQQQPAPQPVPQMAPQYVPQPQMQQPSHQPHAHQPQPQGMAQHAPQAQPYQAQMAQNQMQQPYAQPQQFQGQQLHGHIPTASEEPVLEDAKPRASLLKRKPKAPKAPKVDGEASTSLINKSFGMGMAAGLVLAFALSTILGGLGGKTVPAQVASAPQIAAPVATAGVETASFVETALADGQ